MSNVHVLSPTPASSTIEEEEVNISRLCSILESAVMDNEIDDDGDIYVSDGLEYPVWIELDQDRKLLCFYTYVALDEGQLGDGEIGTVLEAVRTNGAL